jgi:hypothetical protein
MPQVRFVLRSQGISKANLLHFLSGGYTIAPNVAVADIGTGVARLGEPDLPTVGTVDVYIPPQAPSIPVHVFMSTLWEVGNDPDGDGKKLSLLTEALFGLPLNEALASMKEARDRADAAEARGETDGPPLNVVEFPQG